MKTLAQSGSDQISETSAEISQITKMGLFEKIVNGF